MKSKNTTRAKRTISKANNRAETRKKIIFDARRWLTPPPSRQAVLAAQNRYRRSESPPAGTHQGVVCNAFVKNDALWIDFQITSLPGPTDYHIVQIYLPGRPSMERDLNNWLGKEGLQSVLTADGNIDLHMLNGLAAEILIDVIYDAEGYRIYSYVEGIRPPKTHAAKAP